MASSGSGMIHEMENKVVIVTGSSAGIGRATALLLAGFGARLTIHGRRVEKLQEVADEVEKLSGHKPVSVIGNIEDQAVRTEIVDKSLEKFGRIDGLVNNAGWASRGSWQTASLEDVRLMLEVHVLAPYDLCRRCLPTLIENKGNIVMVSSIAGLRGIPNIVAYTTAKSAMEGLMRSLALDTAKSGVLVNSVNPGVIATDIFRDDEVDISRDESVTGLIHPNGKIGKPEEVAECIAFLLTSKVPMLSGVSLPVDGCSTSALLWK